MNVCFRAPTEELENKFISEATKRGLDGLKGHRRVGGMRASIYNACPARRGGGAGGIHEGVRAGEPGGGGAGYAASVLTSSSLVLFRLRSVSRSFMALIGVMPAMRWRSRRLTASASCGQQQLLPPRGARDQVDGRIDPALGQLAAQHQLAVAGALELLEDHLVHLAARVHQRRGDDGERAAALRLVDLAARFPGSAWASPATGRRARPTACGPCPSRPCCRPGRAG